MEAWTLKPIVKILKKDNHIHAYVHTHTNELHIISYDKTYRIWNVDFTSDTTHLVLEKKKIQKYLESIENIELIEIRRLFKD